MEESTVAGMHDLTTSSHMASEQMIHAIDSLRVSVLAALCCLSCAAASARADVRLPAVLSDRMVLQQDSDVRLYGWAYEGEEVMVETSWGVTARGVSDSRGEWSVTVRTPAARPLEAGLAAESITFSVPNENSVRINGILIGEVWLCSGQSNMALMLGPEYPAGRSEWFGERFWAEESARSARPGLRVFNVEKTARAEPAEDCKGVLPDHVIFPQEREGPAPVVRYGWQECSPETAPFISAVAYYFAAALQEKLNVPVGVVVRAVGGSPIQAWMSLESLQSVPPYAGAMPAVHRLGASALYNGMIAPLGPMTLRGVIWYQGESNTDATATHYALLLEALIHDWRRTFRTAELPFGVVQLPGMREPAAEPGVSTVALVREAQADVAARVPGVSLAVTIDVGAATIHPPNKRDVGRRLALHALAEVYGLPVGCEGPIFDRMTREGSALRLFFRNTAGGLTATGASLQNFAIAGSDRKFAWATACIENDGVVVSSPAVLDPVAVRYAWADAPRDSHLVNGEGLPAAPFRTDDFESGGSDTGRD